MIGDCSEPAWVLNEGEDDPPYSAALDAAVTGLLQFMVSGGVEFHEVPRGE